jgi:hypothetical protein
MSPGSAISRCWIGQRMSPDRPSAGAGSASGCRLDRPSAGAGSASGCRLDRPSAGAGSAISRCWIGQRIADHAPRGRQARSRATASGSRVIRHGARASASLTQGRARHKKTRARWRGQGSVATPNKNGAGLPRPLITEFPTRRQYGTARAVIAHP